MALGSVRKQLYLAVGDSIVSVELSPFKVRWKLKVDDATCFGIHYDASHDALFCMESWLSHASLPMASFCGLHMAPISFQKGLPCISSKPLTIDFEKRSYKFGFSNGELIV